MVPRLRHGGARRWGRSVLGHRLRGPVLRDLRRARQLSEGIEAIRGRIRGPKRPPHMQSRQEAHGSRDNQAFVVLQDPTTGGATERRSCFAVAQEAQAACCVRNLALI